jgi:hypothetical protein
MQSSQSDQTLIGLDTRFGLSLITLALSGTFLDASGPDSLIGLDAPIHWVWST